MILAEKNKGIDCLVL